MSALRVEAYRSLEGVRHLKDDVDALNAASRRPAPFATFGYMEAFLAHDEFADAAAQPLVLLALRDERPAGVLALRRRTLRVLGVPCGRIEFLVSHDNERPTMSARPQDEAECSVAFWTHLVEREPGWAVVELMEQEAESPLLPPPWIHERGYWLRRFENNPNATLHLSYADPAAYYRSLRNGQRDSLRQNAGRLFRAGRVELVTSADPRALPRLLDVYLDIEARSWKAGTTAPIARHRERIEFFRTLARSGRDPALNCRVLLLDDLPIAAHVNGTFRRTEYGLETTFDEDYREVAPGNLMTFLTIADAITAGRREVNMLGNYARQKERWLATITDTWSIQVFRRHSPFSIKAHLGDLRRRLAPRGETQRTASVNLSRPAGKKVRGGPLPERVEERRRWSEAIAALEREEVALVRRPTDALLCFLPFRPARLP